MQQANPHRRSARRRAPLLVVAGVALAVAMTLVWGDPAMAQGPEFPELPVPDPMPGGLGAGDPGSSTETVPDGAISIDIGTAGDSGSQSVLLIVGLAVLSLAPSLILMLSAFTRIVIVFSLTRNALGLQGVPPNQVLVGLALFLTLFVMAPTLSEVNDRALQPYLDGAITQEVAYERATGPMREFMLEQTRTAELDLMIDASGEERPDDADDIPLSTLIPAFLLSELKTAFIMGFVIFIPFLIIDIVVAAVLMALGMMMLPPVFVSLPFKLLLFVMVGGWSLIVETLLASFA
ncbi:MAG: flagellar type III secretion system pore protein FliP [Acidimicrobiales bacterium]